MKSTKIDLGLSREHPWQSSRNLAFVLLSYLYQPPFVWFLMQQYYLYSSSYRQIRGRSMTHCFTGLIIVLSWL